MHKNNRKRISSKLTQIVVEHRPSNPAYLPTDLQIDLEKPVSPAHLVSKRKYLFDSLKEWLALISAGAGIFAVLLYLAGRSFASGYFDAMNIPSYQVSFSIWEYGEVAWLPMFIYPTIMIGVAALIEMLFSVIGDLVSPGLRNIIERLRKIFGKKKKTSEVMIFSQRTKETAITVLVSLGILFFMFLVGSTLYFVKNWGELSGLITVLQKSAQIELVSTTELDLQPQSTNTHDYHVYTGYQLLTVNDGKYYVFNQIDHVTCKPLDVYVVDIKSIVQVNVAQSVSLEDRCDKNIPNGLLEIIRDLFSK